MQGKLMLNEDDSWSIMDYFGTKLPVLPASLTAIVCQPNTWVNFIIHEIWEDIDCDTQSIRFAKIIPQDTIKDHTD